MRFLAFSGGFSLIEMILATTISTLLLTFATIIFISGNNIYHGGSNETDIQTSSITFISNFVRDVRESAPTGTKINSSHDAILLISARDSSQQFHFYSGSSSSYQGSPNWQKWIIYYLQSDASTGNYDLVRKEGNPYSTTLPQDPPAIPSPPNTWEADFENSSISGKIVAAGIQTFSVQDQNCSTTGNPLYAQFILSKSFRGQASNYNPGKQFPFGCTGQSGNWIELRVMN